MKNMPVPRVFVSSLLLGIAFIIASANSALAATITVDGRTSIFGAGYAGISADGSGLAPTALSLVGFGSVLSFPSVTGFTTPGASGPIDNPPDGFSALPLVDINSFGGISGIIDNNGRIGALYGLFTSGPIPSGQAAPARLNVTDPFTTQLTFAPLLNQSFFIGDGLTGTGTGTPQRFTVPGGATTLFLGFLDGFAFVGDPKVYHDNRGSLTVEVATAGALPEAPSWILIACAGLFLVVKARRVSSRNFNQVAVS